jgi:hypothetical protein
MKRDLTFVKKGRLVEALDVAPERNALFDEQVGRMIDANKPLQEIIQTMNERGDMTDTEWTAFMFALGYYAGSIGWGT